MAITTPKDIDPALKQRIKDLAKKYFADKDEVNITKFNVDVLIPNNIDYKEYVTSANSPLKRFMQLFPEVFIVESRTINGGIQCYCQFVESVQTKYSQTENMQLPIVQILIEIIEKNGGKALLSGIGPTLSSNYGIDYKEHSGGRTLQVWLRNEFSDIFIIDNYHLLLTQNFGTNPKEISQMNSIVPISRWMNNIKNLQKYTNQAKSVGEWCSAVARGFSRALLGITPIFHYTTEDTTKIIFNTEIKTVKGNSIYCVLMVNPNNNSGAVQPYTMEDFCCVAEEDNNLSSEIKLNVPDILKLDNILNDKYEDLRNDLELLIQARDGFSAIIPDMTERVECGAPIDTEIFAVIKSYYDKWLHAKDIIEYIGWDSEAESSVNIDYLVERLEYTNRKSDAFNKAVDMFSDFAKQLSQYCSENLLDKFVPIIEKDIEDIESLPLERYPEFQELLKYYVLLIEITEYSGLTDELIDAIEIINKHFNGELTPKIFNYVFHNKSAEDLGIERKLLPVEIGNLLSSLDTMTSIEQENEEDVFIDADALLSRVVNNENPEAFAQLIADFGRICSSKLETAIASGDFSKCKALLENGDSDAVYDKSTDEILTIINEWEAGTDNISFTLYECGRRLYETIGNFNRTAEKYFIAGLVCDPAFCGNALIKIYLSENELDSFYTVWNKYAQKLSLTSEQTKYLLYALSSKSEDELKQYLSKNVYIFYVPDYAEALVDALNEFNYTELLNESERRMLYIASLPAFNSFEEQILETSDSSSPEVLAEYIDSASPLLASYGYSEEELQYMLNVLSSDEYRGKQLTPVSRLYKLQKNKNGAVERLIWNSLEKKYDEKNCVILLNILHDSSRFHELCQVFDCYEGYLTKVQSARELYITAMMKTAAPGFCEFVCDNMQDLVNLMANGRVSVNNLNEAADVFFASDDERAGTLCRKIIELSKYSDDFVLQSIILISDDLRDIAIDTEKLLAMGLSAKQTENFASVYKTDAFTRGRDILSLSQRLYSFTGTSISAAKDYALLAMDFGYSAASMLWRIYTDTNDFDAKLNLLSIRPEFRQGKEQEYCSLLFQKKEYEEFLSEVQKLGLESCDLKSQIIIAKCHLNIDISEELDYLCGKIKDISAYHLSGMLKTMLDSGLTDQAASFLADHFEEILSVYSTSEIESIVTASGTISADNLKKLQKTATAQGTRKLSIYIYEYFGTGRLKGASKDFLTEMLEDKTLGEEDRRTLLQHLRIIYAKNTEFSAKIVLDEITDILSSAEDTDTVCTKIEHAIEGVVLAPEGIKSFIGILGMHNVPITESISTSLINMCFAAGMKTECLDFFASLPDFIHKQKNTDILYMLCRMYNEAVSEGCFKPEWADNAINACAKLIETEHFFDAAYCTYKIQKLSENKHYAKFNLFVLLDKQYEIPGEFTQEIEAETAEIGITGETNIFDLFVEMADESDLSEITAYCEYCKQYIGDTTSLLDFYDELCRNETIDSYSMESCVVLLKLLYSNPNNGEYWKCCIDMPLENFPGVYTKLLYKASLLCNKESMWKKCIDACERHSQDDLLTDALIDYAANIPIPYGLQKFREIMAEKTNTNPMYFSQLDEERLAELVSIMCERTERDTGARGNHNAIRDLSTVAISTDSDKAYTIMMDYADKYIFGEECNLGFAIACRLLLRNRCTEAQVILERLSVIATVKYKKLISKLCEMNAEELSAWSQDEVNIQLLNMILPDGNYPDIHKINDFVLAFSSPEKAETGAILICELLDNIPNDYGCYMALFMLCKQLPHRIDMLHRAIIGLIRNKPIGNSKSYYSRSRKDFAILLANINAVIMASHTNESISEFDGYDFTVSAREYYQTFEDNVDTLALNEIQEAQDHIQNTLMNRSEESSKIIYSLVFGYITGNWCEFLHLCHEMQADTGSYLEYYPNANNGLARSVLKIAYSLDEEERGAFISWIRGVALNGNDSVCYKKIETALKLHDMDYYNQLPHDIFEGNILNLPFEENSIFEFTFRNTVSQVISKAPSSVYPCSMLVGFLACSNGAMSEFWQTAMKSFEMSNDTVANKLFAAMDKISRAEHVYHGYINHPLKPGEMYESMTRITGVFSGNEEFIKMTSLPGFNAWSCINMVFALLYTNRANEISHLKQYFAEDNQQLADAILTMISKNIGDEEKLDAVRSLADEISIGIMCYIIRYPDKTTNSHFFLRDKNSAAIARNMLENIAMRHPKFFSPKLQPRHFMWIEPSNIHENAYHQTESITVPALRDDYEDTITPADEPHYDILSIVSELSPTSSSDKTIDELWEEHENIQAFDVKNHQLRLELTRQICQMALNGDVSDKLLNDYAIRFGIDYYYDCMDNKQYSAASDIIIEMVNILDLSSDLDGARMLKKVICTTALHELLHRGYSSIRAMAEAYLSNKQAFTKMRNILPASTMSIELNDVNCIFAALKIIGKCLNETTDSHTSARRNALVSAAKQLGDATPLGWSNIRMSVLQMIRDEINKIDRRPIMDVKIISKTSNRTYGCIYGQVKNIGNDIAENITIQINYSDNSTSNPYTLTKLGKDEIAAFEINYTSPSGTEQLDYEILVTYCNNGEEYYYSDKTSLIIKEQKSEEFPTDRLVTDRPINDFKLSNDGTIFSPSFFGREEEKKKINAVFNSNSFAGYKNIIVKGIRRAGKTSMLNYLRSFANLKCDDAFAVYVTAEGVKAEGADDERTEVENEQCPIQRILIDSVIDICKRENIGNLSEEEWWDFKQKWALPDGVTHRDAYDLQYFYCELKKFNGGKGLMLIIDEFDILIEVLEKVQGVNSTLLPALRNIINSPYCQDAVHLVICGSNKLIRYMDGGTFNQLFQQFGDNNIEIGRLLERDMETMLTYTYRDYPSVKFTPQALNWIWNYTSGLVWYSKLVANSALKRAQSHGRNTVYPTDIVDAVRTVTGQDDLFKSLLTSCKPNEIKVLDAIQCSSSKATEYVTLSRLITLLSDELTQKDIESIINTLEKLQIVQRNPFDRYSYRFAVELYWHYFRVTPSNRERCPETPVVFIEGKIHDPFNNNY